MPAVDLDVSLFIQCRNCIHIDVGCSKGSFVSIESTSIRSIRSTKLLLSTSPQVSIQPTIL